MSFEVSFNRVESQMESLLAQARDRDQVQDLTESHFIAIRTQMRNLSQVPEVQLGEFARRFRQIEIKFNMALSRFGFYLSQNQFIHHQM